MKYNFVLNIINSYRVDSSLYSNMNYVFKFAMYLACYMSVQIITIVILSIYYNINFTDVFSIIGNVICDTAVTSPLAMLTNVLYINLSTYIFKHNLYCFMKVLPGNLLLMLNEMFHYVYKIIKGSIKLRLKICMVMFSLQWLGLDQNIIYYIIISYITLMLVITAYKSDNKSKHLFKLVINLTIICLFWYNIKDLNYINIIVILMHNNMIFTFEEWDFDFEIDLTEIINSLGLHNYSIGDPSSIPPKPPIPPRIKHLVHDADTDDPFEISGKKYRDPSLFSSWDMHMPSENYFREFIVVKDSIYSTRELIEALEFKAEILESDMRMQKEYINDSNARICHKWTPRLTGQSIEDHKLELEWRMFQFSFEYNTLLKANTYYVQGGLDTQGNTLHHSFKDAAEGWQKRQISKWSEVYVDIYKLRNYNPFMPSNMLCAKNYFDDMVAYKEIRENLFWVKLFLIQSDKVLKHLEIDNRNDYTNEEYDAIIERLNLECYNEHSIAYTVHKNYKEWCVRNSADSIVSNAHKEWLNKNATGSLVNEVFREKVHQTFMEASSNS